MGFHLSAVSCQTIVIATSPYNEIKNRLLFQIADCLLPIARRYIHYSTYPSSPEFVPPPLFNYLRFLEEDWLEDQAHVNKLYEEH